jgi:hypothetical protein
VAVDSSSLLPALKSSRLGVGITTVALVALASGTTGVLVAHGTKQLQAPPRHTGPQTQAQAPARTPAVVVDRAPGSLILPPQHARAPQLPGPSARRPVVQVPVVPAPPVEPPVVEPPVTPPVEVPPVLGPPVEPPVVEPPAGGPVVEPAGHGAKHHGKPAVKPHVGKQHEDNGKHLGQLKHGS